MKPALIARRPGAQFRTRLPTNTPVVGMVIHKDQLFVAAGNRVYRLRGDTLQPMKFDLS